MSMWHRKRKSEVKGAVAIAVGAGVGLAAGLILWNRGRSARRQAQGGEQGGRLARIEDEVVDRLRADGYVSQRPIEVAALADGIVELSGTVDTPWESDRAAMVAQGATGVRTVLNRLDVAAELERLDAAQDEPTGPGTARGETHWYGMGVGMGSRRQGRDASVSRKDERVDMVQRELGVDRAVDQPSEDLDKVPNATESNSITSAAPLAYGQVDDASVRRLGNELEERVVGDANPDSADHENVGPGTELTLEQSGVEEELIDRGLEDKS